MVCKQFRPGIGQLTQMLIRTIGGVNYDKATKQAVSNTNEVVLPPDFGQDNHFVDGRFVKIPFYRQISFMGMKRKFDSYRNDVAFCYLTEGDRHLIMS